MEIFEITIEHMRILTDPFARLRNIWLKLLRIFHGIASRSQIYIFMHRFEKVAFEPVGSIFVEAFLNGQARNVIGRNIRLRIVFLQRLIVLLELYDFLRFLIDFRLKCQILLRYLIFDSQSL